MPIYEYQCAACGHQFEALQKISGPALTQCPSCNQEQLQKKVSAASFQLKGTGWYVTDFRDKGKKPVPAESPKSDQGGTDTTKSASTDTKSTPATESGRASEGSA